MGKKCFSCKRYHSIRLTCHEATEAAKTAAPVSDGHSYHYAPESPAPSLAVAPQVPEPRMDHWVIEIENWKRGHHPENLESILGRFAEQVKMLKPSPAPKGEVLRIIEKLEQMGGLLPSHEAELLKIRKILAAISPAGEDALRELSELATKAETHPEFHDNEPGGRDPKASYCRSCWLRTAAKEQFMNLAMTYVRALASQPTQPDKERK